MKPKQKQKGFTLIELLVVISIIGLLASVVLVSLNSARQKSRNAKRLADANQIAKGLEIFYNQALSYPTGTGAVGGTYTVAGGAVMGSSLLQAVNSLGTFNMTPTFMTSVPTAPTPADGSCDASNNRYMYEANSSGTTYTLSFCLGATTGNYTPGVKYLTPSGVR
ncbi:MAG: prepilin-type N-terminal cleavage/methylation domain-containing protein [Candidatus Doudnabacteria bacterium]|nr:prepilin-type N-terminal cleavage/methylation domain-containing protein [Candidatus Doudnabacteria bacterium]